MNHLTLSASYRLAGVAFTLVFAMDCRASLLDCAKIPGIDRNPQSECMLEESHHPTPVLVSLPTTERTPPPLLARSGFHVSAPQTDSSVPDSLPLVVFFIGLFGVMLIRAKSCNNK